MKLDVTFSENTKKMDVTFEQLKITPEGGYDHGYENGYQEGFVNGRAEGETEGYNEGKADGYSEGAKSEYDLFWDNYQDNGTRKNYNYSFYTTNWNEKTFRPKYKLVPTTINNAFRYMQVPDFANACDLDTSKCTDVRYAFAGDGHKHIGIIDLSSCTGGNVSGLCSGAISLHTVDKLIWNERITEGNVFYNCPKLVNVLMEGIIACTFAVNYCNGLSRASLESIINILKDYSGTDKVGVYTLNIGSANKAKLTEDEITTVANKGWNIK